MSGLVALKCLGLIACLVGAFLLGACRDMTMEEFEPERPPSVPETATWAGGADGGAWIECSFVPEEEANWCTAWNDQTGEIAIRTDFVLRDSGKGLPVSGFSYAFFSGHSIELADGRILEPRQFRSGKRDPWESPPIEPARSSTPPSNIP